MYFVGCWGETLRGPLELDMNVSRWPIDTLVARSKNADRTLSGSQIILQCAFSHFRTLLRGFLSSGVEEATNAGRTLKRGNYVFDVAHTSVLKRAQHTLCAILNELGQTDVPVHTTWRLNERHYGGLTGLDKAQTAAKYGEEQVHQNIFLTKLNSGHSRDTGGNSQEKQTSFQHKYFNCFVQKHHILKMNNN